MQIIGFNFTKIAVERSAEDLPGNISRNTNVEFVNVTKENLAILKDAEALKVDFKLSITYSQTEGKKEQKKGEVVFEGNLILAAPHADASDFLKTWKKKEVPNSIKLPLLNIILKKCTTKALDLEEQVNLPPHIPLPQLQPKQ